MGHERDWVEKLRRYFVPRLGKVIASFNELTGRDLYVESETSIRQFAGRVELSEEKLEDILHGEGFQRNPLASLKKHHITGEVEEGSWRKVGYDDHPNKQLHVIIYDGEHLPDADSGYTYVYAHWEYRWDTHPLKHYMSVDVDPEEGVKRMQKLLDERGIYYDMKRPHDSF